jgi:hypothetical protein
MDIKSTINFDSNRIEHEMLKGLKSAFADELKKELLEVAEKEVDKIVETISKRLELKLTHYKNFNHMGNINLQWIFKKED